LFTRAGSFNPDENGDLVNTAGFFLQGYNLQNTPNPPPSASTFTGVETVNISNLSGTASATTQVGIEANLPSISATDTFNISVQIFDSLGNPSDLDITFTRTGTNAWSFSANDPVNGGATMGTAAGDGTITFDGSTGTPSAINITTPFAVTGWTTGAADSNLTVDLNSLTQFGGNFDIDSIVQDGVRFGTFTGISINDEGIVTALFDNGQQLDIYRVPLATFANTNGLEEVSGNAYLQTNDSGSFQLNLTGNGGAGQIAPGALESSTVDIGAEFTNIIVTQRAYSASARTISTADEMLEELIRIL
ncbi:MAG: flagellar hook-basal body complex protein, partial [Kiloniellales bacterium]|nr:flagellar hook-basal body complex protein [Kiloniellales bacterium]